MELKQTVEFMKKGDNFLLSSHINPDGDGVGSILGLLGLLHSLGKKYRIICQDMPQEKLSFLKRFDEFEVFEKSMVEKLSFDHAIIIDSPFLDRIGDPQKLIKKGGQILNIDHHVDGGNYGTVNLVVPDAAASAQIIASIYERMGVDFDLPSAEALYVGLVVDTGRFRYSNTTPEVFLLAAKLISAGVKPDIISDKLFYQTSLENKIGLAKVLESIELHFNGRVASANLDYGFLSSPTAKDLDTEGFVNQPLSLKGVDAAFLIRESEKGKTRVSLRSRSDDMDVNKIAQTFGGGGHVRASGCRIEGTIPDVKSKLLAAIKDYMNSGSSK
jgi:phosphoesterase RecJ-like protein